MRSFAVSGFLLLLSFGANAASASDATTYAGTIGKLPVIVELQDAGADGTFVGRYSYLKKGTDIPLHGQTSDAGFTLGEEKPCTVKICTDKDGNVLETPPIGAQWVLTPDGRKLTGTWTDKDSGKSLPVVLEKKGVRTLEDEATGMDALDPSLSVFMRVDPPVFTAKDLPYDFLKMAVPLTQGKLTKLGDIAYRMDADPRTTLDYPVVTELAGQNIAPLNRWLGRQRLLLSLSVFWCPSKAYLGAGWYRDGDGASNGYDDGGAQVTVDYLTTRLMGLTESGSYYCGGAHPDNFLYHYFADARTGRQLVAERLLRGWEAKNSDGVVVDPTKVSKDDFLTWGPDKQLYDYVQAHRDRSDSAREKDCGLDELVQSNLGVYFKDGKLVFTLRDLPYVSFACGDDLVSVPLKDARPLLTGAGAKYFTELDQQ